MSDGQRKCTSRINVPYVSSSGIMMAKPDGTMSFNTTMSVETYLTDTITSYIWDMNGDGTPDQTGDFLTQVTGTYTSPGLYFPTVTITDTMGNIYTETTIVNVLDRAVIDALLQSNWNGMKTALLNGDIEGAVGGFNIASKDRYKEIFYALGQQLTPLVQDMQNIQMIYVKNGIAKYRIRKNETIGVQAVVITYYIYFTLDGQGLWKIEKF